MIPINGNMVSKTEPAYSKDAQRWFQILETCYSKDANLAIQRMQRLFQRLNLIIMHSSGFESWGRTW